MTPAVAGPTPAEGRVLEREIADITYACSPGAIFRHAETAWNAISACNDRQIKLSPGAMTAVAGLAYEKLRDLTSGNKALYGLGDVEEALFDAQCCCSSIVLIAGAMADGGTAYIDRQDVIESLQYMANAYERHIEAAQTALRVREMPHG
jgi:hypothetical protein